MIPIYQEKREKLMSGNVFKVVDSLYMEFDDALYYADSGRKSSAF
jgi:hypothetical protein